jgi:hypothetical protein
VLSSHHVGFLGGEFGFVGQPGAFARKLRDFLDGRLGNHAIANSASTEFRADQPWVATDCLRRSMVGRRSRQRHLNDDQSVPQGISRVARQAAVAILLPHRSERLPLRRRKPRVSRAFDGWS